MVSVVSVTFAVLLVMGPSGVMGPRDPNGVLDTQSRVTVRLPTMTMCTQFVEGMSHMPPIMESYVLQVAEPCRKEETP